jgi:Bacterial Ig domain
VPTSYMNEAPADTSETVDFGITVEQNPYPLIGADHDLAVPHGAGPTRLDLLGNDSDPDDEALKIVQVTQGAHGSVAIVENGAAVTYDPDTGYSGPDTFDYVIEDTRGGQAWAPVTVVVAGATSDTTAPTVGSLARSLPAQAIGTTSVKVALSWKGTDVGTGVASYRLERRIGSGAWTKVTLPTPTTRSTTATLTIDTAYSYRVRATDVAGNVGAWAAFPTLNPKRIQDTSSLVAYTGTWTKVTNSSLSGGTARYASSTSRRAKVTFTGQEVALVATRRTTGGRAEIRVDGVVAGTVDLDASSTQYRRLVFRKGFASTASHTLEVRPLGDGRVEIDAFIVLR